MNTPTCIYVIGETNGPNKIGFSRDPNRRRFALQSVTKGKLRLLHICVVDDDEAPAVERCAHYLLRDKHYSGEWFSVSAAVAIAAVQKAVEKVRGGFTDFESYRVPRKAHPNKRDVPREPVLIRFEPDVLAALRRESATTGESVNSLVIRFARERLVLPKSEPADELDAPIPIPGEDEIPF